MAPGTILRGGPGSTVEVVGTAWEDTRHLYLRARRRFRNFQYPAATLVEAPDDEALAVLVRAPAVVPEGGETHSDFEHASVLTRPGMPWFLELIDLVEATPEGANSPWLVLAEPHAQRLVDRGLATVGTEVLVAMLDEVLIMLKSLHGEDLGIDVFRLEDFLIDSTDRWFFLGTDRVRPASGPDARRDDLRSWARLADSLFGVGDPPARSDVERWPLPTAVHGEARARVSRLSEWVRRIQSSHSSTFPSSVEELVRESSRSRNPSAGW